MKMWKVEFDNRARKELRKLDPDIQQRILKWLRKNIEDCDNPRQFGKPLKGHYKGLWRYRSGECRIICQLQDQKLTVLVVRIGHRKDIYRGL